VDHLPSNGVQCWKGIPYGYVSNALAYQHSFSASFPVVSKATLHPLLLSTSALEKAACVFRRAFIMHLNAAKEILKERRKKEERRGRGDSRWGGSQKIFMAGVKYYLYI